VSIKDAVKTTLAGLGALFRRPAASPFADGLEPVPDHVADALMYRLLRGEFQPDVPKRIRIEQIGADYWTETKYRDG
jgi:hypothetical protein